MKLSIIIPTLNEAEYLKSTIESIRQNSTLNQEHEIIVVDSGSDDATCEIAKEIGASLLKCTNSSPGKSHALNEAASAAAGDVYLFLDADTFVPGGYDQYICTSLTHSGIVGGAFEFALDGPQLGLRVVELINRIRYRIRQRYYGDQGLFVRAEIFHRVGGYPEITIMESAYLCEKLRKLGQLTLIPADIKTSPRRFIDGGIYRVLASDIKIWFLDLIGAPIDKYGSSYWRENKLRSKS